MPGCRPKTKNTVQLVITGFIPVIRLGDPVDSQIWIAETSPAMTKSGHGSGGAALVKLHQHQFGVQGTSGFDRF